MKYDFSLFLSLFLDLSIFQELFYFNDYQRSM